MTPQQSRVLAAAKAFNGTCSADWINGMGPDGKGKISRVPARIEELAELYGCEFEPLGRRGGTKVYRLVSGPDRELSEAPASNPTSAVGCSASRGHEGLTTPPSPGVSESPPTLFDLPSPGPVSPYEEAA